MLEHTADVGLRVHAATLEEVFDQATRGLLDILGAWREGAGTEEAIEAEARDVAALLVDWLDEVLFLHDSRDAVVTAVRVDMVQLERARGSIYLAPRGDVPLEGTGVKAATYHKLRVEETSDGWTAQVYLDV